MFNKPKKLLLPQQELVRRTSGSVCACNVTEPPKPSEISPEMHATTKNGQKRENDGEFGNYGENDNFATITNKVKHKAESA